MEEATDEISEMQPRVTKKPQEKKASWRQVNIHCILQSDFNNLCFLFFHIFAFCCRCC